MSRISYYYLSFGEKAMMYTLRHFYQEPAWTRGEGGVPIQYIADRDYHVQNLSTDYNTAVVKGAEKAKASGVKFKASKLMDLQEIKRRSADEMEQARVQEEENQRKRDEEYERQFNSKIDGFYETLAAGRMPYGMFAETKLVDLSADYVLHTLGRENDPDAKPQYVALSKKIKETLKSLFPELLNMNEYKGGYIAEVGAKKVTATAQFVKSISFEGAYGTCHVDKFITDEGEMLVYMGSASKVSNDDIGKKFNLTFTVKSHEEYQDQEQTKMIRIKAELVA